MGLGGLRHYLIFERAAQWVAFLHFRENFGSVHVWTRGQSIDFNSYFKICVFPMIDFGVNLLRREIVPPTYNEHQYHRNVHCGVAIRNAHEKIFKTSLIFGAVVFAAVAAMNFSMNSFAQETPSSPPGRDTTSAVAAAQ